MGNVLDKKSVRQETTMFQAGTCPLNMYKQNVPKPAQAPVIFEVIDNENVNVQNEGNEIAIDEKEIMKMKN